MQASLIAKLGLDKSGFDAGIAAAGKQVNKFGGDMARNLAAGLGAAAMVSIARQAIQTAEGIEQMAKKYNLTTDEVQLLQAESQRTGESMADLTKNAAKLESTLSRLRGGDVLFSREQIQALTEAGQILKGWDDSLQQAQASLIADPSLLLKRVAGLLMTEDSRRKLLGLGGPGAWDNPGNNLPDGAAKFAENEAAKKREVARIEAERMEIVKKAADIQKQADEQLEKNRIATLSKEERIAELAREREAIFDRATKNELDRAQKQLDLAKNEADLQALTREPERKPTEGFKIQESAFGRIGAFTGAAAMASMPPGQAQQIQQLQRMIELMSRSGILVKDVR